MLIISGIDTDIFKPHSTCSAFSLCATFFGLSLSCILERIKNTWEWFYNKAITTSEEKFQKAVIDYEGVEDKKIEVSVPLLHCYTENFQNKIGGRGLLFDTTKYKGRNFKKLNCQNEAIL